MKPAAVFWFFTSRGGVASDVFTAGSQGEARARLRADDELHGPFGTEGHARDGLRWYSSGLEWTDPTDATRWLAALSETIDDLGEAAEDQTRPMGQRRLGRAEARRIIDDARSSLVTSLGYARRGLRAPSDPAGSGGR